MNNISLRNWFATLVIAIWASAAVVAFFTQNFEELGIVTPVMMIVTGFIFGYKSPTNGNGNGNGKKHDDDRWSHLP